MSLTVWIHEEIAVKQMSVGSVMQWPKAFFAVKERVFVSQLITVRHKPAQPHHTTAHHTHSAHGKRFGAREPTRPTVVSGEWRVEEEGRKTQRSAAQRRARRGGAGIGAERRSLRGRIEIANPAFSAFGFGLKRVYGICDRVLRVVRVSDAQSRELNGVLAIALMPVQVVRALCRRHPATATRCEQRAGRGAARRGAARRGAARAHYQPNRQVIESGLMHGTGFERTERRLTEPLIRLHPIYYATAIHPSIRRSQSHPHHSTAPPQHHHTTAPQKHVKAYSGQGSGLMRPGGEWRWRWR